MYSNKYLLSQYLEDYLSYLERIQDKNSKNWNWINYVCESYPRIPDIIYAHLISNGKNGDEAYEESKEKSIIKELNKCLNDKSFTESELNHIYCHNGRGNPFLDIALKRYFFIIYGTDNIDAIIEKFIHEGKQCELKSDYYKQIISLLNKKFETKEDVTSKIYSQFEERFNREFNCGGYALEVFDWVSCECKNHDETVSKVLLNPSVRLLGESVLKKDEYLVVLDATSYHFIKYKDGKFVEKCGSYPANDFEGWPPLRDEDKRDLVYFAVKNEHDMDFRYDYKAKILSYEELINKSINDNTYSFEYHGHSYNVALNEEGNYDVLSNNQKVAEAMIDKDECIVDIMEDKKEYVRNTKSKYYDDLYKEQFKKVRTKPYGIIYDTQNVER